MKSYTTYQVLHFPFGLRSSTKLGRKWTKLVGQPAFIYFLSCGSHYSNRKDIRVILPVVLAFLIWYGLCNTCGGTYRQGIRWLLDGLLCWRDTRRQDWIFVMASLSADIKILWQKKLYQRITAAEIGTLRFLWWTPSTTTNFTFRFFSILWLVFDLLVAWWTFVLVGIFWFRGMALIVPFVSWNI